MKSQTSPCQQFCGQMGRGLIPFPDAHDHLPVLFSVSPHLPYLFTLMFGRVYNLISSWTFCIYSNYFSTFSLSLLFGTFRKGLNINPIVVCTSLQILGV